MEIGYYLITVVHRNFLFFSFRMFYFNPVYLLVSSRFENVIKEREKVNKQIFSIYGKKNCHSSWLTNKVIKFDEFAYRTYFITQ